MESPKLVLIKRRAEQGYSVIETLVVAASKPLQDAPALAHPVQRSGTVTSIIAQPNGHELQEEINR